MIFGFSKSTFAHIQHSKKVKNVLILSNLDSIFKIHSHIWPPRVAIFLAFWVWEAFGASQYL